LVADTKISAEECLHSAQELSLLRHTLADDVSTLSGELVSSMSREQGQATLLEDLETMHRSLKELDSVRTYVEVIESALKLRYGGFPARGHHAERLLANQRSNIFTLMTRLLQ
jgi:RAD50-interacting protein 1